MDTVQVTTAEELSAVLKNAAPDTRIMLAAGEYRCKAEITARGVSLIGNSPEDTKIVWGDYAKKLDESGTEYNTFRTYTAAVLAQNVTFKNLTVENDARSPETKGQEVALTICAETDEKAEIAMQQLQRLKGCEAHTSVILSQVDSNTFRKLGVNLTSEPAYQGKKLFHG